MATESTDAEKALQTQLDEANAALENAEQRATDAEKARDEAVKEAKAARKALNLADPETVAKNMNADYQKGKNYDQLSQKYKMTVAEVAKVIGA